MIPSTIKRWLLSILFRMVFSLDFVDIDEKKRFEVYRRMNQDDDIKLMIRSFYTRNFHACTLEDNHDMRLVIKGRMLAYKNMIDMMEGAEETLKNWEKRQKIVNRIKQVKQRLLNNSSSI